MATARLDAVDVLVVEKTLNPQRQSTCREAWGREVKPGGHLLQHSQQGVGSLSRDDGFYEGKLGQSPQALPRKISSGIPLNVSNITQENFIVQMQM